MSNALRAKKIRLQHRISSVAASGVSCRGAVHIALPRLAKTDGSHIFPCVNVAHSRRHCKSVIALRKCYRDEVLAVVTSLA